MSPGRDRMVRLVGERYADCGFSNFDVGSDKDSPSRAKNLDVVRGYATNIQEHRQAGRNLILIGGRGTGKDHLATAVMRHAIVKGFSVAFTRGTTLAKAMISASKGEEGPDEKCMTADFLCISDIEPKQKEEASATVMAGFLELIDERYRRRLPTIVTSNAKQRSEMITAIGDRAIDRLLHDAIVVRNLWNSYREVMANG
jgi:DNA replication protein DnaC